MKKTLITLLVCAAAVNSSNAQNWSVGVGTGPFVFGDFIRQTRQVGNETGSGTQTTRLSAATRAGLSVDIERRLTDRFAFRINRNGAFRFHVMGGPAYAVYDITSQSNPTSSLRPFSGSRARWGAALGGGIGWWLSDRFAVEGQITDISTESPFRREELPAGGHIEIPRPHNVHTSIGIRYRF